MGLVQKAFSDIITFSRSSNATRVGPTGLVEYAPHNLILQSQTFDNASWTVGNATVTANAAPAPDGTVTAELLTENSSFAAHRVFQSVTTTAIPYTASCYLKAGSRNWGYIRIRDSGSTDRLAFFNLATGVLGATGTGLASTIQSVGNGWYRCTATLSSPLAGSNPIVIGLSSADGTEDYTGNGTGNIYLWGAQLSVGPYALDYTPTTSAAVYGPRFDYNGSGVTIVEPVSRNLLTYSEQFDNAAWTKAGSATVTENSIAAPDGTITADLITTGFIYQGSLTYSVATLSVYVKAGTSTDSFIYMDNSGAKFCRFNATTGVITATASGYSSSITAVGNGWYRITFTGQISGACGLGQNGSGNGYFWGAQLEVGSTATGYMVSGATNGFRAVPVVSGSATPRGLLVEEQRTNLLVRSEEFDNAAWTKTRLTITANSIAAPDGTVSADTFTSTSTTQPIECYGAASISASTTYTYSAFFKSGTHTKALLRCFNGGSTTTPLAIFDLSAKSTIATYGNVTATSVQDYGNGWVRCIMTFTSTGTTGNPQLNGLADTYTVSTDFNYVSAMSTNGSVYVWGAQLEAGSFATSYIPTLASTVTRSADVASVNTLSPWYSSTGTIYTEIERYASSQNVRGSIFHDGTTSNYIGSSEYTFGGQGGVVVAGGVAQAGLGAGGSSLGVRKLAFAFGTNDFALSENGGAATTDTSGTVPTVTTLGIGSLTSANVGTGYIRRIAFYPRRLTNAELQALTA